ncbi:unnamed protein product, partial [Rotaria sp. Silwood2]
MAKTPHHNKEHKRKPSSCWAVIKLAPSQIKKRNRNIKPCKKTKNNRNCKPSASKKTNQYSKPSAKQRHSRKLKRIDTNNTETII